MIFLKCFLVFCRGSIEVDNTMYYIEPHNKENVSRFYQLFSVLINTLNYWSEEHPSKAKSIQSFNGDICFRDFIILPKLVKMIQIYQTILRKDVVSFENHI